MKRRSHKSQAAEPEFAPWPQDLTEMHERMRAEDQRRIESGEATPEQIQRENSLFPADANFKIVKFGI
jgi:hypothetical protein